MNLELLIKFLVNGLFVGALYGMVAMCFVLIYKASRIVNFAQGEFLLVGAWICWWLLTTYQTPFLVGFLITLVFMSLLGVLIQVVILRPLIGEPIISIIMVTVGLSIVFQAAMKWAFGVHTQSYPDVFTTKTVTVLGLPVETAYVMSLAIAVFGMAGFAWLFKFSKIGLAMRATAFNQQIAQSLGVSVRQVFAISWAVSAMVSALAGIVVGMVNGVSAQLSVYGIRVFPAVILGGLDSLVGAVVGGIVIGLLENIAEFVDGQYLHVGNLYVIAPFYVLVAILVVKPYGLFGTHDIERL